MSVNVVNEVFKFAVAKRDIEEKLGGDRGLVLNEFAQQGHVLPPGMVGGTLKDVEVDRRIKLSIKDSEIVKGQIDIELQQLDLLYKQQISAADISYKQSETALLNAFDEEVANTMFNLDMTAESLALAALQIEERGKILIDTRTTLGLERETLQQQMLNQDLSLLPYQTTLVNARIAVIAKKLEIIPFLQQVVVLEQQLIAAMTITLAAQKTLEDEKKALIDAKTSLLPLMTDIANARGALANAEIIETGNLVAHAQVETQIAQLDYSKTAAYISMVNAENNIELIRRNLVVLHGRINLLRENNMLQTMQSRANTELGIANTRSGVEAGINTILTQAEMGVDNAGATRHSVMAGVEAGLHNMLTQVKIASRQMQDTELAKWKKDAAQYNIKQKLMANLIHYVSA